MVPRLLLKSAFNCRSRDETRRDEDLRSSCAVMATTANPFLDYQSVCSIFEHNMTVAQLKEVIKHSGLGTLGGRKQDLIARIKNEFVHAMRTHNLQSYNKIRRAVLNPWQTPPHGYQMGLLARSSMTPSLAIHPPPHQHPSALPSSPLDTLTFSRSPFYDVLESITLVTRCQASPSAQYNAVLNFKLKSSQVETLQQADQRVYFFATSNDSATYQPQVIEFPTQAELRVNGEIVSANLKGVRKQAGTTRPPDITKHIQKNNVVFQRIELAYANTNKQFLVIAKIVKEKSIATLIDSIKQGKTRSKESVVQSRMQRKRLPANKHSHCSEQGQRHPSNFEYIKSKMPHIVFTHYNAMSVCVLLAYTVLRCRVIPHHE